MSPAAISGESILEKVRDQIAGPEAPTLQATVKKLQADSASKSSEDATFSTMACYSTEDHTAIMKPFLLKQGLCRVTVLFHCTGNVVRDNRLK